MSRVSTTAYRKTKSRLVLADSASAGTPLEFRGFQAGGGASGTISVPIDPTHMTGSAAGDLLVACVCGLTAANMADAAGQTWTAQASLTDSTYVYKVWTAIYDGTGDGITTGFVKFSGQTSDYINIIILCYKKDTFDATTPVDVVATGNATGASFTIPAITTTKANVTRVICLASGLGASGGGGFASPFGAISSGGFTLRDDNGVAGADNKPSHRNQDKLQAAAGASGSETTANSRSASSTFCCHLGINAKP